VAIDLPLKALISEDENSKVFVAYNSPEYLQQRHGIPDDMVKILRAWPRWWPRLWE